MNHMNIIISTTDMHVYHAFTLNPNMGPQHQD